MNHFNFFLLKLFKGAVSTLKNTVADHSIFKEKWALCLNSYMGHSFTSAGNLKLRTLG